MTETIVRPTAPVRRGIPHVNALLDAIVRKSGKWTTDKLADRIMRDGITGQPNTDTSSPVGLWVLGQLHAAGVHVTSYTWVAELGVYSGRHLIGEVRVPEGHTLYDLDAEINDGDRSELCDQGEGDPR